MKSRLSVRVDTLGRRARRSVNENESYAGARRRQCGTVLPGPGREVVEEAQVVEGHSAVESSPPNGYTNNLRPNPLTVWLGHVSVTAKLFTIVFIIDALTVFCFFLSNELTCAQPSALDSRYAWKTKANSVPYSKSKQSPFVLSPADQRNVFDS